MTALIIGLISAICTGLSFIPVLGYASIPGLILAIVAWIVGSKAVKANPADGKAKAGKIIGMIITILAIVSLILVAIAAAALVGMVAGAVA
ncbi:MAG: hypothetical protein VB082_07705 [Christensenella sp.]|nr:hypothetical protein [Christensenella sp.]